MNFAIDEVFLLCYCIFMFHVFENEKHLRTNKIVKKYDFWTNDRKNVPNTQ